MNRNKSVRVTPISKLTKNEYEHEQQIPNTKIVYSTAKQGYIDTVQTHNQKDRVLRSKDFLCQSAPSFNFVQHSVKLTSKDRRKKTNPYKKLMTCIIITTVLIIIAVSVYILTRFLPKSSRVTTISPTNITLRWKTSAITLAGVTALSGNNATEFNLPIDLALDSSNSIYVTDYYNNRIQKWISGESFGRTVAGQTDGSASNATSHLFHPDGVYVDSNENIYASDTGNNRIMLWMKGATNGTYVAGTGVQGSANNQLNSPYGITKDPITNKLYIADFYNNRVMGYPSGVLTGSIEAGGNGQGFSSMQLNNPVGIYLDSITNSLFIANFQSNNIVRWPLAATNWTLVAGNLTGAGGSSSTMLNLCAGVTLDPMSNVYVADSGNQRIQFFSQGQMEGRTIAGVTGTTSTASNHLSIPYNVRLDHQLNLYVVDSGNNRIQKFERY